MAGFVWSAEPLTLTDRSGNRMTGKVVTYTPPNEMVKLNTTAGYKLISFRDFTDESQRTIEHWLADREFKASGLRISIEPQIEKIKKAEVEYISDIERVTYTITLENRSAVELSGIEAEYQVFFEQELPGTKLSSQKYRKASTLKCGSILPGQTKVFTTKPVDIEDRALRSNWIYNSGASKSSRGRLQGMLLLLSKESVSDELLTVEEECGRVPNKDRRTDYQKIY